jgi:glyoxylate reductase
MGRIGKAVALRAQAFGLDTVYFDPHRLNPSLEKKYQAIYLPFDELLSSADIITLHASLTPKTFHMISDREFHRMKKTAILINASRGPVIDERALASALEKGLIWGAGLDVYEREPEIEPRLLALDNVVLLPHVGSASYETRNKMAMMAATNLVQGLSGQRPDNLVSP